MKKIVLGTYFEEGDESPTKEHELLESVIRNVAPGQQGFTIDDMRKGMRVLDALEMAEKTVDGRILVLEDSDYTFMKKRVEAARWVRITKPLLDFIDKIMSPEELDAPSSISRTKEE